MDSYTIFVVVVSYKGIEKRGRFLERKTLKAAEVYRDEVLAMGEGWGAEIREYEVNYRFVKKC